MLEGGAFIFGVSEEIDVGGWGSEAVVGRRCATSSVGVHLRLIGGLVGGEVLLALVLKPGVLADEVQIDGFGGTAAVFGNDEFG